MDQITRFEFIVTRERFAHEPEGELLEDPDGDYILYEDHQRIVADLKRQLAAAWAGDTLASKPEDDEHRFWEAMNRRNSAEDLERSGDIHHDE